MWQTKTAVVSKQCAPRSCPRALFDGKTRACAVTQLDADWSTRGISLSSVTKSHTSPFPRRPLSNTRPRWEREHEEGK